MIEVKRTFHGLQRGQSRIRKGDTNLISKRALSQRKSLHDEGLNSKFHFGDETTEKSYLFKYVFHPESALIVSWDITAMVFIIYQSIEVPFRICFDIPLQGGWNVLEFIITISFMFDILLNFNTGFYSRGSLIMNRKEIAKNYAKGWFLIDFFSTMPYTWFLDGALQDEKSEDTNLYRAPKILRLVKIFRFMRILKLMRLTKLKRILMKIEDYIASNALATAFVFLRLLAVVFFIAHWTACWWFFIGNQDSAIYSTTWITTAKIIDKTYATQYITSLYWAFTTMTTVGYGDITPYTINEKIYAMFTMILACGVFAYTVGSIGSLVSKQNAVENAYREQIVAVNRYMKKKNLPYDLQFRVRRYLEYVWENKKKNNMDEKQILSLLSEPLRDEIYTHIHGVVIKHCEVFKIYDLHFISLLTKALESETFAPGDIIFQDGEFSNKMYFLQNGTVDIYQKATNSVYSELGAKSYFGEIAFFIEKPRCASAKCMDFVDLLSLSRNNVNYLLEKFPEAMQATNMLVLQCSDGNLSELLVRCYVCNELGHVALFCRKILLNNDYMDTKQRWLRKRHELLTKTIDPSIHNEPAFLRKLRTVKRNRYDFKHIVGVPRPAEKIFPDESGLVPKIKKFLERPARGDVLSTNNTVNSVNETPQVTKLIVKQKSGPKYSMIYRDSESSDEDYEEEFDFSVTRKFKNILVNGKMENSDTAINGPDNERRKSKIIHTMPMQKYKRYKNNSNPTPFNTIDEGYEADSDS
ncbi:hypothetical protein SteCoe_12516 [Stentor coeruleus]|uniref:Cyclic nucleotide-binding domain-containing protein n=1 Tax=Stentor coeruleus TaxID=5963 RepID=A0A1R2CAI6_9CILI|nr:hypothetical protein SteCoe_12516 [Stentor coeruleus]